ncbi:ras-associating and dilute domain-containing protein-like isoform X2 [Gadus morhua]|uniref:ras-associating and dilute domain-containing protein-like isoform X2 n=1 Tax=Gadus morhua TaxID=8049 RepID=UPI0011B39657|nr:ras-associating and dilute domain-containing protein-like isoform X2 [Gadus morhua]
MISEERSSYLSKQALNFPVGLLIGSPKRKLAKLGRKPSNGSLQSNHSDVTVRSAEGAGVRQPAKSKIRRHNNRLSTVFTRSPSPGDGPRAAGRRAAAGEGLAQDDPAELSSQMSAPGILKVFGSDICQGTHYKSVLATVHSSAKELVKEALERYCLEKEDPSHYLLCDVIGQTGADHQWRRECFRVVGDQERPLVLQSLWKPKDGFSRRFEIQRRGSVEEQRAQDTDTVTAGLNAQARRLTQRGRARVTSLFLEGGGAADPGLWRSLSEMDLLSGGRAPQTPLSEDPEAEADKEVQRRLGVEKEETESSDDCSTQFSVHPPFDFPYFLLLQGYSHKQDFVVYLLSGGSTVFGRSVEPLSAEDEERQQVDIVLSAPDVAPQHCCVRRLEPAGGASQTLTLLRPLHGAAVTRNGAPLGGEVALAPGDLVGLGGHYLFMFKDPTRPAGDARTPAWMARLRPEEAGRPVSSCLSCGSSFAQGAGRTPPRRPPCWRDPDGSVASLVYDLGQEDRVLQEVLALVDPGGPEPKLTPAFLLSLCIQHAAASFQPAHFRRLLLRIACQIQLVMWEKTKELAATQPDTHDDCEQTLITPSPNTPWGSECRVAEAVSPPRGPWDGAEVEAGAGLLSMEQLGPGLGPLLLWMANAIELLHFIQRQVPGLLPPRRPGREDQGPPEDQGPTEDQGYGAELAATRAACEEAMTVLEEVIMFTFQQSVYYLTKSMYCALPGLLDGNPFSESVQLRVPGGVRVILGVLSETLKLLKVFLVHPDISRQLCAYLFYFINASIFNALMERGSGGGFYQWSRGVQIRANLDLLMDWVQSAGLGDLALEFFRKLSAAVNVLATPKENLLQASWSSLRGEFSALNPAQLHHMLREYNSGRPPPPGWSPPPDEAGDALRTADILESFEDHPPLVLPSGSFHLELGGPPLEQGLFLQLQRLQDLLQGPSETRASGPPTRQETRQEEDQQDVTTPDPPSRAERPPPGGADPRGELSGGEARLTQKLRSLELQDGLPGGAGLGCHKGLALDPSCLLTPPNTPQDPELRPGPTRPTAGVGVMEESDHTENDEDEEDEDEVFTVELNRGPHGLGMALVDGLRTPLRSSGVYVKSVVPGSPAARCLKLRPGHRILAVNGVSLVGMEYPTGRERIRSAGNNLRLLVATDHSRRSSEDTMITKC